MAFGCDDFYSYGKDRDNANRFGLAGLAIAAGNFAIAGLALAILPAAGPAESA
jgi:hypothetical protein